MTLAIGKWEIFMTHNTTIPHVDNVHAHVNQHYPQIADLLDDHWDNPDGTTTLAFTWVGTVYADENNVEAQARARMTDDGYPHDMFTINEDWVYPEYL